MSKKERIEIIEKYYKFVRNEIPDVDRVHERLVNLMVEKMDQPDSDIDYEEVNNDLIVIMKAAQKEANTVLNYLAFEKMVEVPEVNANYISANDKPNEDGIYEIQSVAKFKDKRHAELFAWSVNILLKVSLLGY